MRTTVLGTVDWDRMGEHYEERLALHSELIELHDEHAAEEFAALALGISDRQANYSAVQHGLGPRILSSNRDAAERVWELANALWEEEDPLRAPALVRQADLHGLGIGVGSELACMMVPDRHWVVNIRTIYAHSLLANGWNVTRANEALKLYRQHDPRSPLGYDLWADMHPEVGPRLRELVDQARDAVAEAGLTGGGATFLWADCIADALYAVAT